MQSGSDMVGQMMDGVMPGLAGIQTDMMTLLIFFLGIGLILVGAMVVMSILSHQHDVRIAGGWTSEDDAVEGAKEGNYSGESPDGLVDTAGSMANWKDGK